MSDAHILNPLPAGPGPVVILQDHLRHGGSESHTVWLASKLRAEGVDIRVLTFRPGGPLASRLAKAGVPHEALQSRDFGFDGFAPGLVSRLRRLAPSRVLLMGKVANAYAPWIRRHIPALDITGSVRTGSTLPWYVRRALRAPARFVCNCEAVAASLAPMGVARAAITVIPNPPVTTPLAPDAELRARIRETYTTASEAVVVLCVAGFRKKKGHADLIRATAACASTPVLWLAGDGPERAACERLAAELGVADRVRFLGHVADPRPLYVAADLASMASSTDAMSNFLVESALHGLPIVAWDFAGTRETFVDGKTGALTPYGDHARLASALDRFVSDSELRGAMSVAARAWAPTVFSERGALATYRRLFGL